MPPTAIARILLRSTFLPGSLVVVMSMLMFFQITSAFHGAFQVTSLVGMRKNHRAATAVVAVINSNSDCDSGWKKKCQLQHRQKYLEPTMTAASSSSSLLTLLSSQHQATTTNNETSSWSWSSSSSSSSDTDICITSYPAPVNNDELVRRRIDAKREKRERRYRNLKERAERNLEIKRLLHVGRSAQGPDEEEQEEEGKEVLSNASIPSLVQVRVWVDDELRRELKLSGRERRGRVFIGSQNNSDAVKTLRGLRQELHNFFSALRKDTYVLRAKHPRVVLNDDGKPTIGSPVDAKDAIEDSWKIESDEDVVKTFMAADEMFINSTTTTTQTTTGTSSSNDLPLLKRPSIQINVMKNPDYVPPPTPEYLVGMADPEETESMTMLSFYAFPPSPGIEDPERFAADLKRLWRPFQALGRVYVAQEGVNAQMSVPTNVLQNFIDCASTVPEFEFMENGMNIDPKPLSKEEFAVAGVPVNGIPSPPFKNLHIRVRSQVVADGLNKSLDWSSAGYDCPPIEWHERLKRAAEVAAAGPESSETDVPIVLDCRNTYETDVGIFEGAEPLGTENFRDSWDVLKDRLADTPKDAPIMTYCTGGIRCVKVGAYLTQEMGFTNVSRLAGGIIAYDRTLNELNNKQQPKESGEVEPSLFKGTNFVFDGRVGRQITSDALSNCVTCGTETSLVSNCRNDNCHIRIVQCEKCKTAFHGTCSPACKNRVVNGGMVSRRSLSMADEKKESEGKDAVEYDSIDSYVLAHSSPISDVYTQIELNTKHHMANGAHMVSGASQGQLLKMFASMSRSGRILECGTFSGYATACLIEGAQLVGSIKEAPPSPTDSGPYVLSLERDQRAFSLAAAHLDIVTRHGFGEEGIAELEKLRSDNYVPGFHDESLVSFQTQDGSTRIDLMRVNDALAVVESLADKTSSSSSTDDFTLGEPFDLVFIDADKGRLIEYAEACLANDSLLRPGGLMIVDNTLWKGLVLEAAMNDFKSLVDDDKDSDFVENELSRKKNRRARKLANQMHAFNSAIVDDPRAEVTMLPIRDGLTIVRKK